jgi:hypothetical protein
VQYNERQLTQEAVSLFHAGFLLGLLFNPEDGGNMIL